MEPRVQVALDLTKIKDAVKIGKKAVEGGVDWIEAGTPLIKSEGLEAVESLNEEFSNKKIVADMKTIDTGDLEVSLAAEAGADVVSVFGAAADETIEEAVQAAGKHDVDIIADLIALDYPSERVRKLEELGVDFIGIHVGIDQQDTGKDPLKQLNSVVEYTDLPIAVAGGLDSKNVAEAVKCGGSIIVVGSAITKAKNPTRIADEIVKSVRGLK